MKIAVVSQDCRTVFDHAGKARRFIVYKASTPCTPPVEIDRLDLGPEYAFHGFNDRHSHPLDGGDALIVGCCGSGFPGRLARRGIEVVATSEQYPLAAIQGYFDGHLPQAHPHDHAAHDHHGGCSCGD